MTDVLDAGDEVADLARTERRDRQMVGRAHADLVDLVGGVGLHHADAAAVTQRAVHDADRRDDAAVVVEVAVEDQAPATARRRRPWARGCDGGWRP